MGRQDKMKDMEAMVKSETVDACKFLYDRKLVTSTGGNVSARGAEGTVFITPSGESLGRLTAASMVKTDLQGKALEGGKPSKEVFMHCAVYRAREDITAVVHTHSAYAVVLSCIATPGEEDVLPAMTPGHVVKVGPLKLVKYFKPGSAGLAESVWKLAGNSKAILLQNHGLITFGKNMDEALNIAEDVEESAKIYILSGGKARRLTCDEVKEML